MSLSTTGGNFSEAQELSLGRALDLTPSEASEMLQGYAVSYARKSALLLWLLLRGNSNAQFIGYLKARLPYAFAIDNSKPISLSKRLGPLLIALILGNNDDAQEILQALTHKNLQQEKRAINEALIFAAAHGNLLILTIILRHFKHIISPHFLIEALEAAALQNQLDTFKTFNESDMLGDQLQGALERSLMTAAAQHNTALVEYILDLDKNRNLNIAVLPVAQRMDLLLKDEYLDDEARRNFAELRARLAQYMHERIASRRIPSEPRFTQLSLQNTIPALTPELLVLIWNFLKPPTP